MLAISYGATATQTEICSGNFGLPTKAFKRNSVIMWKNAFTDMQIESDIEEGQIAVDVPHSS